MQVPTLVNTLEPQRFSVNLPAPLSPTQPNPINKKTAAIWINTHTHKWQATAKKLITSITYRSFAKFEQRLKQSITMFNYKIMSLPKSDREYVILIPNNTEKSSNTWASALALKYLAKAPKDIILMSNVEQYKRDHPEISRVLLIDDAAYSGKQMCNHLSKIPYSYKRHLIIPFMTRYAYNALANTSTWIAEHERILNIKELNTFDLEELEQLKTCTSDYDQGRLEQRSLTYFQHKIPDSVSTLQSVLATGTLIDGSTSSSRFIPWTIPPYR